ncbi:MAG: HPF/RaiA family ribosome-associated protein [Usitatibacter sp.]
MRFTQITFHHMTHSPAIGERIREMSGTLEERYPEIRRCRVGVEQSGGQKRGRTFKVTADVRLADGDLVSESRGADIETVLRAVFADLGRRLEEKAGHSRAA